MDACPIGASGLKIRRALKTATPIPKSRALRPLHGLRTVRNIVFDRCLALHNKPNKAVFACQSSDSDLIVTHEVNNSSEETKSSDAFSSLAPTAFEVESLLTELCDTSIAEFELKLGGFRLYVMGDVVGQSQDPQLQSFTAPAITRTVVETSDSNGLELSPKRFLTQTLLDQAADEGLMILQSPRVGYFRRSRTIKGKRARPSCNEKDIVKEGQVL